LSVVAAAGRATGFARRGRDARAGDVSMSRLKPYWLAAGVVVFSLLSAGCASTTEMSPKQREGVELRRYCEQHPQEVEKCLGFLGWV
jgi:hypothetical protein